MTSLIAAIVLVLVASPCSAGGIFHFLPAFIDGQPVALERATVVNSRSRVIVSDTETEYVIDQTFSNNNDQSVEGVFLLPYESGSPPGAMSVIVNGVPAGSEILSPEEFLPLLFELTAGMGDPSLLELSGKGVLLVRHLQLAPKKEKSIQVRFVVPRGLSEDYLAVVVPLWGERFSLGPVAGFEIFVRFKMSAPVRAVFSTTHEISVFREAPHRAVASCRSRNKPVRQDFVLFATLHGTELDVRVFCQRTSASDGVFMAMVSPPLEDTERKAIPKEVVFALDISGSIDPAMRDLSQQAVMSGIERLGEQDRFNVVTIGTRTGLMQKALTPASRENVIEAVRYLNSLEYGGGTDLFNGTMTSLEQFSASKRQRFIVLLTDGRPTVGTLDIETLTEGVRKSNRYGVKIFAIALGDRADTAMLWQLSEITRGSMIHLHGVGGFETQINKFYEGITQPTVRDVSLQFENVSQVHTIPDLIPDLSGGASACIFGSYEQDKPALAIATVKARVHGRSRTISRSFDPNALTQIRPYIPLVYAMRRMAKLMERERLTGLESGISEEMAALSDEYGFKKIVAGKYPRRDWGRLYWNYKTSLVPSQVESEGFRRVGDKLFRLEGSEWIDSDFRPSLPLTRVLFMSDAYFQLIKSTPGLGAYLSLGSTMTYVVDGKAVQIVSSGMDGKSPGHQVSGSDER